MSQENVELVRVQLPRPVRKGKIVGVDAIWDHAEALETLGLSE